MAGRSGDSGWVTVLTLNIFTNITARGSGQQAGPGGQNERRWPKLSAPRTHLGARPRMWGAKPL